MLGVIVDSNDGGDLDSDFTLVATGTSGLGPDGLGLKPKLFQLARSAVRKPMLKTPLHVRVEHISDAQ